MKKTTVIVLVIGVIGLLLIKEKEQIVEKLTPKNKTNYKIGQAIDSLNGVAVFYNGSVGNVTGRNTIKGYNVGLKYQCVEFVKRYYYEFYKHKMPDSYGHAKSFYDLSVLDGKHNKQRNLTQYTNPSKTKPKIGDLVVMDATFFNAYGHVAIISKVRENEIEIIQQNPGVSAASRVVFGLKKTNENKWKIENKKLLGWLRK